MAPKPGCAMDTPASPRKLAGCYEVRQILGQGGMGLVYRAYDTVVRREVAVKTILDIPDPASLQLFYKECDVLASMSFTPADAQVTLAKAGEAPARVSSGGAMSLAAGSYTLTAKTADNFIRSATIEVTAGQSKNLDLSLAPDGMLKWDDPAGWKQEKGSFVRKGGDFVMYNLSPTSGTFVFSAMLAKGHRLQWVLNCSDVNNYILFQMDDNNFYRTVIRNGQKGDEIKIPHKNEKKSFRTLQIRVATNEIVHQIRQGDSWVVLDRWTPPGSNLSLGRFGFYIPGNDQVALSSFGHYVDLTTR
ncbi:MAG: hypothetical protein WBP65_04040 [Candidatus Sulfotelmatobacter sp.]